MKKRGALSRAPDTRMAVPEKLRLVVNLNTAKAINFRIRPDVLERADRLVQ